MSKRERKADLRERVSVYKERYKWIFSYARKHVFAIVVYTIIGMSGALATLFTSLVSRDLVDIITGRRVGDLLKNFILMILIQLAVIGINNISMYVNGIISFKVENEIKADIYDKIMITDWESLSKYHSGNIISRWTGDTASVASGILNTVPNAVISLFRFFMAFYMVVKTDYTFVFFAIAGVPLSFFVSRQNLKRLRDSNLNMMDINTRMTTFSQESFADIQNIKALDMVKLYAAKLRSLQKDSTDARVKYQRTVVINSLILTLVSQLVTYSTYGWGVYRVWSDVITYGEMTMFLTLSSSLTGTAQSLIGLVPSMITIGNNAGRILEVLNLKRDDYSHYDEAAGYLMRNRENGIGLEIRDASFTYRTGTEVFEDVSFEAHPRSVIGLVGPSGEGKTTMLRLILAIICPGGGKAFLKAEVSGETMDISASTRQLFAYVPQGNTMFNATIAENLRNVKEDATDEEIIEALKLAAAWDFVKDLPDTINTKLNERGGGLSEGQTQRLSIARALIRRSPILLLDEATSALDIDTQKKVLEGIMSDTCPRTVILTTHRPEVMDICDRVYTIKDRKMTLKENG